MSLHALLDLLGGSLSHFRFEFVVCKPDSLVGCARLPTSPSGGSSDVDRERQNYRNVKLVFPERMIGV
jgi:hypothetical protein